jgi:hypothetical protein
VKNNSTCPYLLKALDLLAEHGIKGNLDIDEVMHSLKLFAGA